MSKLALFLVSALVVNLVVASLSGIPPEANYNFTQYIDSVNYPYEQHQVVTEDGYILTYFRIQAKNTQIQSGLPVIFAHHGLLDSADSWILNLENESPGLILANAGYDVWFGNSRGNKYCLDHVDPVNFNSSDSNSAFWEFSWQDFSELDLPAGFTYISDYTGQSKFDYIGHSQGTTIMFAALARADATILQHLNRYLALAPVAYLQYSTSPIIKIGAELKFGYLVKDYDVFVQDKKFGFMSQTSREVWEELCIISLDLCIERVKLLTDSDPAIDNTERLKITTGHFPAGTSVNNMMYWQQMYKQTTFNMYDFGTAGNLQAYGQSTPPKYNLGQISPPVYLFAGQYDELASPQDTADLRDSLTGASHLEYRSYPLGHSSFMYGLDVASYMQDVLAVLSS